MHTVVVLWPLPGVCEQLKHLSPSVMILAVSGGGGGIKNCVYMFCDCFNISALPQRLLPVGFPRAAWIV